jgi:hypothetical protein
VADLTDAERARAEAADARVSIAEDLLRRVVIHGGWQPIDLGKLPRYDMESWSNPETEEDGVDAVRAHDGRWVEFASVEELRQVPPPPRARGARRLAARAARRGRLRRAAPRRSRAARRLAERREGGGAASPSPPPPGTACRLQSELKQAADVLLCLARGNEE